MKSSTSISILIQGISVHFKLIPENEKISSFFSSIRLNKYEELIKCCLNETGISYEYSGIIYFNQVRDDWESVSYLEQFGGIHENEVNIYDSILRTELIISQKEFEEIVYDVGQLLIANEEFLINLVNIPVEEMTALLSLLKQKLDNYPSE